MSPLIHGKTLLLMENGAYYFSPNIWINPIFGARSQPGLWEYLGNAGWSINDEVKRRREEVFQEFYGLVPESPNEYSEIVFRNIAP